MEMKKMCVSLTVAESKRLIAKGVAASDTVQNAMKNGTVAVAKGTTNSYVVEEITGESIKRTDYCTGVTLPEGRGIKGLTSGKLSDLVISKGERLETTAVDAVSDMKAGDVFIKGANALNYDLDQAALLIGHPTGGTIGATIGTIIARRITLLIPIGLEKSVPIDLVDAADFMNDPEETVGNVPALWPLSGMIFTEIEAFETLTGVEAIPVAGGGIAGAEGAVRLLLRGDDKELEAASKLVESLRSETSFIS